MRGLSINVIRNIRNESVIDYAIISSFIFIESNRLKIFSAVNFFDLRSVARKERWLQNNFYYPLQSKEKYKSL